MKSYNWARSNNRGWSVARSCWHECFRYRRRSWKHQNFGCTCPRLPIISRKKVLLMDFTVNIHESTNSMMARPPNNCCLGSTNPSHGLRFQRRSTDFGVVASPERLSWLCSQVDVQSCSPHKSFISLPSPIDWLQAVGTIPQNNSSQEINRTVARFASTVSELWNQTTGPLSTWPGKNDGYSL